MPHNSQRILTQAEAINESLAQMMSIDPSVIIIGEGVPDPKSIFGTTEGLYTQFGENRVFDMPLSENAMTGICIGAALSGLKPVLVHQRIEFALLSMDQIVNNAAKWHYMFSDDNTVPMVIRMIVGRGWGQGPQHSQSLQSLFSHIPGLTVVMPTTPYDAKGMLNTAIEADFPVIYIEHRWLHSISGYVPEESYSLPLNSASVIRDGGDITITAFSYMLMECIRAADVLKKYDVEVEVIDMRSVRPLDVDTVLRSVEKTRNLIVTDTAHSMHGASAELIASIVERDIHLLDAPPVRITPPDYPTPTSHFAANDYYPDAADIIDCVLNMLGINDRKLLSNIDMELRSDHAKDIPNPDFVGPF